MGVGSWELEVAVEILRISNKNQIRNRICTATPYFLSYNTVCIKS